MGPCCCDSGRDIESEVLVALLEHAGERIQLSDLANELGIDEGELRATIIKLRGRSVIETSFDGSTGELVIGEPRRAAVDSETKTACASCDYQLPPGARFCPSCGSSVE
ncbi:MAG: zinc ribbon domain-containing protein [Candidatus Atabeyarchaeum deiterrae]